MEEVRYCQCFERLVCKQRCYSESRCRDQDSDEFVEQQSASVSEEHSASVSSTTHTSLVADYSDSDSNEPVAGTSTGQHSSQASYKKPKLELPSFITGNSVNHTFMKI